MEEVGPVVTNPVRLQLRVARIERDSTGAEVLVGQILFTDHYGNLQTNIPGDLLDSLRARRGTLLTVQIEQMTQNMPFVRAYADVPEGEPLVLVASTGRLEVARNQDSAADLFNPAPEAVVRVRKYR